MSTGPQTPSQYVPSTPLSHQQSYPPQHYEKFSTSTFFQSPGHHVHSTPHGTSGMSHYQQPGGYGSAVPGGGSGGAASTGPSTQLIPSSSTNIHNMIPSEYYYEERSKLEKLNFDLKMKIFHLEEQQKSNLEETKKQDLLLDSSKAELLDYKLQLEEKEIELEQRNLLLLKAKNAIENLKHEIEKSKQELSRCQDLETRVLKLKELNDEMDLDSKQQVMILEHELERMYDVMKGKEQEKIVLEERLKQLEDNFQSQGQRLQETMTDKIRVEERIKQLTIHVQNNDEEITQCYAQIDLLKIQLIEENEQQDKLKLQMKELNSSKTTMEEQYRSKIIEITSQCEIQMTTMRINNEQDMEKMRAMHSSLANEIRENYQEELRKIKENQDKYQVTTKEEANKDILRIREDCATRLEEKNEEIHSLRQMLENHAQRQEALFTQLDAYKQESHEKKLLIDHFKHEMEVKQQEQQATIKVQLALESLQQQYQDLQDNFKAEHMLKLQLQVKYESLQTQANAFQQTIHEKDAEIHVLQSDINKLASQNQALGSTKTSLEDLQQHHDKYQVLYQKISTENMELKHALLSLQKDFQYLQQAKDQLKEDSETKAKECEEWKIKESQLRHELQEIKKVATGEHDDLFVTKQRLHDVDERYIQLQQHHSELQQQFQQQEEQQTHQQMEAEDKLQWLWQCVMLCQDTLAGFDEQFHALLDSSTSGNSNGSQFQHAHSSFKSSAASSILFSQSQPQQLSYRSHSNAGSPTKEHSSASASTIGAYRKSQLQQQTKNDMLPSTSSALEHFKLDLVVTLERLEHKVERITKLKAHFQQTYQKFKSQQELQLQHWNDQLHLLQHRLDKATQKHADVQQVLTRDQRKMEVEVQDMRDLKMRLLGEHTQQLQQQELKLQQMSKQLEEERIAKSQLQHSQERLQLQLKQQVEVSQQLQHELQQCQDHEELFQQIEQRMERVVSTNELLQQQSSSRQSELQQAHSQLQQLQDERNQLQVEVDRAQLQQQMKEEHIHELQQQVVQLQVEVEHLRSRQIDPDLASTLLQQHSALMLSSQHKTTALSASYSNSSLSTWLQIEAKLLPFLSQNDEHVDKIQQVMQYLMQHSHNLMVGVNVQELMSRLLEETQFLITENRVLLTKVLQYIAALKSSSASASNIAPVAAPEKQFFFPNRKGLQQHHNFLSSQMSHQQHSHSGGVGNGGGMQAVMELDDLLLQQEASAYSNSKRTGRGNAGSTMPSYQSPQKSTSPIGQQYNAYYPQREEKTSSPIQTHAAVSQASQELMELLESQRRSFSHKPVVSTVPSNGKTSSGKSPNKTSSSIAASASFSASTNGSTARLSKLDKSLQQLAKKLDAFDLSNK